MLTFRSILQRREQEGETSLFQSLLEIEASAHENWLSLMGEKWGSHNGLPHLKGVESNLDRMVPGDIKRSFSSTEIFLLLAGVLLHDIGKIVVREKEEKKESENRKKGILSVVIFGPNFTKEKDFHNVYSCLLIQERWPMLRIPNEELAQWLAVLACSHGWDMPSPVLTDLWPCQEKECSHPCAFCVGTDCLNLSFAPYHLDGPIRLQWLAALIRLADEVDNQLSRAVHPFLRLDDSTKTSFRRLIRAVVFDPVGQCIRLQTVHPFCDSAYWDKERKEYAYEAVMGIDSVLKSENGWKELLAGIGLGYERAFLEENFPQSILHSPLTDQENPENNPEPAPETEPALASEPAILEEVQKAARRLAYGVINWKVFSWRELADEAGLSDERLAELALRRIIASEGNNAEFQVSNAGWYHVKALDQTQSPDTNSKNNPWDNQVIPIHIEELDYLIWPPQKGKEQNTNGSPEPRGIPALNLSEDGMKWISPIISIIGSSGEGKTTLALQIAHGLAQYESCYAVFYSLEQEPENLEKQIQNYNRFIISKEGKTEEEKKNSLLSKICG